MIENTSDRDPLMHLIGALDGSDRYIADMEAAGQWQLLHSDRLPVEILDGDESDFVSLGFTFGESDSQDPLFRPASLPEGWQRKGSDHDMWSYIVDRHGRRRVSVFYKAAFYDRRAHMRLNAPEGEVHRLVYGEFAEPVIDDWTPREVWLTGLSAIRDKSVEEIARLADRTDSLSLQVMADAQQRIGACDAALRKLEVA
jgi:hypothetical protein